MRGERHRIATRTHARALAKPRRRTTRYRVVGVGRIPTTSASQPHSGLHRPPWEPTGDADARHLPLRHTRRSELYFSQTCDERSSSDRRALGPWACHPGTLRLERSRVGARCHGR